jgi:hypothetical protein
MGVIEGRGDEILAVAILFFCLTWLTVCLRVYVRAIMLKTWGWDDWTMSATLVCEPGLHSAGVTDFASWYSQSISPAKSLPQYMERVGTDGNWKMNKPGLRSCFGTSANCSTF